MPNIGELIGDRASKLLREGVEGFEKATEKSIAKGEAKFVRDNLSTDWKEITGPEIKRFKGKSATLSNGNNPDLENRILNQRAKFDEAEVAAKNFEERMESEAMLKKSRDALYEDGSSSATKISDKKFKFTRYGGKTREIKNPISQDFENAFSKEFNDVTTNQKGFVPVDAKLRNTLNIDTALDNLKGKGYSSDVNKFNNMVNSAKDFRQKVRDGNVVFEAGDVKVTKRTNKFSENMDGFLKKAVPVAVGGGLVFSMFNRGGQMSNSELYGQQQQYGGGQGY